VRSGEDRSRPRRRGVITARKSAAHVESSIMRVKTLSAASNAAAYTRGSDDRSYSTFPRAIKPATVSSHLPCRVASLHFIAVHCRSICVGFAALEECRWRLCFEYRLVRLIGRAWDAMEQSELQITANELLSVSALDICSLDNCGADNVYR